MSELKVLTTIESRTTPFLLQAPPRADTVQLPSSAVIGLTMTLLGALIVGSAKFLVDQALSRWKDKIEVLQGEVNKLEAELSKTPSNKTLEVLEQRLINLGGALQDTQRLYQDSQKEFIQLQKSIASSYVNRDDYVKHVTLTDAKLDAVHRRLDEMMMLLMKGRGNAGNE